MKQAPRNILQGFDGDGLDRLMSISLLKQMLGTCTKVPPLKIGESKVEIATRKAAL